METLVAKVVCVFSRQECFTKNHTYEIHRGGITPYEIYSDTDGSWFSWSEGMEHNNKDYASYLNKYFNHCAKFENIDLNDYDNFWEYKFSFMEAHELELIKMCLSKRESSPIIKQQLEAIENVLERLRRGS